MIEVNSTQFPDVLQPIDHIESPGHIRLILKSLFQDSKTTESLLNEIQQKNISNFETILEFLRQKANQTGSSDLIKKFDSYEQDLFKSILAYHPETLPNVKAAFWPNPARVPDANLYSVMPVIKSHHFINKNTPVASAGSCFAVEIAKELQRRKFNYVITENCHSSPEDGILVDDYSNDKAFSGFSANWGMLFTSPSLLQLAQRGFGTREFQKILMPWQKTPSELVYIDPYRENVTFLSPEAYEKDYINHTNAIRKALTSAEYFVFTLGLNECWEFMFDGSFIAQAPPDLPIATLTRLKILTVEENVFYLQSFLNLVRQYNPNLKLILSVSPVPLYATALGMTTDVITANMHSKSVLRVAAQEMVTRNEGVYYFPSFEQVLWCTRDPWESDFRHVNPSAIKAVMDLFEKTFVSS